MKITQIIILLLFSLSLSSQVAHTEFKKGDHVLIKLTTGSKVKGTVADAASSGLIIANELGEIKIDLDNIKSFKKADSIESLDNLVYRSYGDNYLLLPSARPVGAGETYYKNIDLFYNAINFGISDNFSISAGTEILSLFRGEAPRVFFLSPKFSFGEKLDHVSIGTNLSVFTDNFDTELIGLATVNYTRGTDNKNFTLGVSLPYSGSFGTADNVIINLGGMLSVSKRVTLISEVLFVPGESEVVFDLGARVKFASGITFDVGFATASDASGAFPLLGVNIPF